MGLSFEFRGRGDIVTVFRLRRRGGVRETHPVKGGKWVPSLFQNRGKSRKFLDRDGQSQDILPAR